jgi:HSP20 family protein
MFNLTPWKRSQPERGEMTRGGFGTLARFRDEMDGLFNQFFGNWPEALEKTFGRDRFWALDFDENEKEFIVKAEAPGFEASDLDVSVSGNLLTIKADKKCESKEKKGNGHFEERHFERVVTLPSGADPDKVEAKYRNGILEIHLAKTEDAQRKKIPVKADSDIESSFKLPGKSGF